MKRKLLMLVGVVVVLAVGFVLYNQWEPQFLTKTTMAQAVEQAKKAEAPAPAAPAPAAPAPKAAEPAKPAAAAPADGNITKVKFETSKGNFVVEVHKDLAPNGVARFLDLVKTGFYNDNRFFRVVPGFVVQWGIPGDPKLAKEWMSKNIADDPVKQSNLPGTICFAAAGRPNTRSTQVFINFANNANLDAMGFAAFGKVTEGMDVVQKLNGKYNEQPTQMQSQISSGGNEWLDKTFPGLDYIKTATIIP